MGTVQGFLNFLEGSETALQKWHSMKWTLKDKKKLSWWKRRKRAYKDRKGKKEAQSGEGVSASPTGQESGLAPGEEGSGKEALPSADLRTFEP